MLPLLLRMLVGYKVPIREKVVMKETCNPCSKICKAEHCQRTTPVGIQQFAQRTPRRGILILLGKVWTQYMLQTMSHDPSQLRTVSPYRCWSIQTSWTYRSHYLDISLSLRCLDCLCYAPQTSRSVCQLINAYYAAHQMPESLPDLFVFTLIQNNWNCCKSQNNQFALFNWDIGACWPLNDTHNIL